MARSDHVTAFKDMLAELRTDTSMTLSEKLALIAKARKTLSRWLDYGTTFQQSITAQQLNAALQETIDTFDEENP